MPSTLVLTREYSPHRIVSWQDAVTDLFAGRCEVVESYDTDLRSTSLVIKCPAVVRLLDAIPGGKRAVELDPTYAAAYNNLAVAHEQQGQFDEARKYYQKALDLEPDNLLIQQNFDLFKEINDRTKSGNGG